MSNNEVKVSLFDFGDLGSGLGKAAHVIAERFCDGIGGLAKPRQIVRTAVATAQAKLIVENPDWQMPELHKRGLISFINSEGRKQNNRENTVAKVIPLLKEGSTPEDIDDDLAEVIKDKIGFVSDEDIQSLWAGLIAGAAEAPKESFTRLAHLLATFDKRDAKLVTDFCSCMWGMNGATPIIFDINEPKIGELDLSFAALNHLSAIGVVYLSQFGYSRVFDNKEILIQYFDKVVKISLPENRTMDVGCVMLTEIGYQLFRICNPVASNSHFENTIKIWAQRGLSPEIINTAQSGDNCHPISLNA